MRNQDFLNNKNEEGEAKETQKKKCHEQYGEDPGETAE
jgi:hypothetical protein